MAKTESKTETNVDNTPEAIAERAYKSAMIEARNAVAGKMFGKTYDDLDADKKAEVRKVLKGGGRKDGTPKGEAKPKDAYATSIQTEPFGRHISILLSPKLFAKAQAMGRIEKRSYSNVIRELIDKKVDDTKLIKEDYIVEKDGAKFDVRKNKVGQYNTPEEARKAQ